MLNPGFKSLDPDKDQLEKVSSLFEELTGLPVVDRIDEQWIKNNEAFLKEKISSAGVVKQQALWNLLEEAGDADVKANELVLAGIRQKYWNKILNRINTPVVIVLGILTGEGLWTGLIAGASDHGIDYIATFNWLWQDDPELASKQKIEDFDEICHAAERRFGRRAAGLFAYLDEFKKIKDSDFDVQVMQEFIGMKTAAAKWL